MATRPTVSLPVELAFLGMLALLWGSSYLFIRVAVAEIPPLTLIASRVSIAALFLLVVVHVRGERFPRNLTTWRHLLVQAFFTSIGAWTILAWGQQYIDASMASVLNSTSPIFVFFITFMFTRHEATSALRLVGACLGLAGVTMIVGVDVVNGLGRQVAGQLAALTGALLYACAAIYGKKFSDLPAAVTAAAIMIWASVWLLPLSLIIDRPWTLRPSFAAIMAAAGLALLSTGIALTIYFRLLKTLGSMGVASQAYLRAGVGVILGVVILGETMTPIIGLGLLAAILGVALINIPVRERPAR